METPDRRARFCQLHQRQDALLHPSAAGGREDQQRQALGVRPLRRSCHLFPDRRAHRAAHEIEVEGASDRPPALNGPLPGEHGFGLLGLGLGFREFVRVALEPEWVGGGEPGVIFLKAILVQGDLEPLHGGEPVMVGAFRAHLEIPLQFLAVDEIPAPRALCPDARRHLTALQ